MTGIEAMVIAGMAVSAAATAASTAVAVQNSKAQSAAASANAKFYRELGERNAQAAIADAKAEEDRFREDARQRLSIFETRASSAGATLAGSPLAILSGAVADAEENAMLIRHAGAVGAQQARLGLGIQSRNSLMEAGAYRSQATQSLLAGFGQTVGGGLSSYGSMYNYGWRPGPGNNTGMFA